MQAGEEYNQILFLRGTRTAIILTSVSLVLCLLATRLPLYGMWYHYTVDGSDFVRVTEHVFYFDYLAVDDYYTVVYLETNPLEGVMEKMTLFIAAWAAIGLFYIACCVLGTRALLTGFLLQACCVVPVVYFAARMPSALSEWHWMPRAQFYPEDFIGSVDRYSLDGTSYSWGPMSGWFVLVIGCAVQFAAVLWRNAPMMSAILTRRDAPNEGAPENHGPETQ